MVLVIGEVGSRGNLYVLLCFLYDLLRSTLGMVILSSSLGLRKHLYMRKRYEEIYVQ